MTSFIKMIPIQVDIAAVAMMLSTAIGAALYKCFSRKTNPLTFFRYAIVAFILSIVVTCIVIAGPEQKVRIYPCAMLWGVSWGLLITSQRVLYCTLSPRGQQTEIIGLFAFVNIIIGWLP